jgi:hypothetical protein
MPSIGAAADGQGMPVSMYLQKLEQTSIFEDPDQVENYTRDALKDIRPDAPFLESDQKRTNTYAMDFLNLRHSGKRVTTEPHLPDGSFLDFEFLNPDSRGTAVDPNMMLHRKQQEARGKFIKMGIDSDDSVPSQGLNPTSVIRNIKKGFYLTKDRLKIFDESMNNFSNKGVSNDIRATPDICLVRTDEKVPEMQDEICNTRSANYLTNLSNETKIGWDTTTDNRFQIAKYGQLRRGNNPLDLNVVKNKENAMIAHDIYNSWQGKNSIKKLTTKMIDISNKKKNDMQSAKNVLLSGSKKNKTRKVQKISPQDLIKMRAGSKISHDPTSNQMLNGTQSQHATGAMLAPRLDSNRTTNAIIDPFIINFMSSYNKKFTKEQTNDLRNDIKKSGAFYGLLHDRSNKKQNVAEIKNEMLWNSVANYVKGSSMNITNYTRTKGNSILMNPKNKKAMDYEVYNEEQKIFGQRRGNQQNPNQYIMDSTDYDQRSEYLEHTGTKLVGGMGNKYMRNHMDYSNTRDLNDDGLGEVCARN